MQYQATTPPRNAVLAVPLPNAPVATAVQHTFNVSVSRVVVYSLMNVADTIGSFPGNHLISLKELYGQIYTCAVAAVERYDGRVEDAAAPCGQVGAAPSIPAV